MGKLREKIEAGSFAITAEMAPPKGWQMDELLATAGLFRDKVDAVNVTDFQSASLKASSIGLVLKLQMNGIEPILQMTGRDRSRMAIQGDFLAARAFGVQNILALTGDHTTVGDCKDSKPVYDLDSVGILQAAMELNEGHDCGGNALQGEAPDFFLGACVTPVYDPMELQIIKLRKKIDAGAKFVQTQAIFDLDYFKKFLAKMDEMDVHVPVMAGIIPLKTAGMAKFMNRAVPGIKVPDEMIARLTAAGKENAMAEGMKIAAELIREIKEQNLCAGIHLMTIGAERNIPKILEMAGL